MFGFTTITEFTHVMESLLDKLRSEECPVTQGSVGFFLHSLDLLRNMLAAVRDNTGHNTERGGRLREQLEEILENGKRGSVTGAPFQERPKLVTPAMPRAGGAVMFRPHRHLLTTGNDPLPMLGSCPSSEYGCVDRCLQASALPGS